MERILRVDERGRVTIPRSVRKALGVGRFVRIRVENGKIVLEPVRDALEELSDLIIEVRVKASMEPSKLSEIASNQLMKEMKVKRKSVGRD